MCALKDSPGHSARNALPAITKTISGQIVLLCFLVSCLQISIAQWFPQQFSYLPLLIDALPARCRTCGLESSERSQLIGVVISAFILMGGLAIAIAALPDAQ